jgi:hypothetical protein
MLTASISVMPLAPARITRGSGVAVRRDGAFEEGARLIPTLPVTRGLVLVIFPK